MRKDELVTKLEAIEKMLAAQNTVLMTFNDAKNYLKISASSLYKLVHYKKLRSSKPNGKRLWFSKQDIDAWALSRPSKTADEIEDEAIKMVNSK